MYKVIITDNATNNINFIKSYIGEYSPVVLKKIFHTISHLSYFPNIGINGADGLLEIIDGKYKFRIIYKIDNVAKIIYIVSVFKGKPSWD